MLKTIEEHNQEIKRTLRNKLTGIVCPNCNNELQYVDDTVYLTFPGQKDVKCYSCGFTSRVLVK